MFGILGGSMAGVGIVFALFARGPLADGGRAELAGTAAGASALPAKLAFFASIFGIATGFGIAFGADTPLFTPWFRGLESAHYGGLPLDAETRQMVTRFFGPVAACTIAQFLLLLLWLRREVSLRVTVAALASIGGWFLLDSGYGLANDGLFNIVLVNLPAAVATLPPWIWLHTTLKQPQQALPA